eukprot:86408-Pyramimonas_sp.AAC.1
MVQAACHAAPWSRSAIDRTDHARLRPAPLPSKAGVDIARGAGSIFQEWNSVPMQWRIDSCASDPGK